MKIEKDILRQGLEILESILDEHGIAHSKVFEQDIGRRKWDAKLSLPELKRDILIEAKTVFQPKQINEFAYSLGFDEATQGGNENLLPLIIARRITESAFDCCKKNKIAVVDLSGNVFLKLPGAIIERYREPKGENKHIGTSGTVFSAKASRIVRALLSCPKMSWDQARLVKETGITQGYVSRILAKLQSDRYLFLIGGIISLSDPDRLLDDWVAHYRFDRHVRKEYAISFNTYEEGLQKLSDELNRLKVKFAFTGWSGAFLKAPYGIPPLIMAYVGNIPDLHDSTVLFPVQPRQNGNVILYQPQDEGVFKFSEEANAFPVISAPQLYLDMSRMPGRAKEQAEALREKLLNYRDILK